MQDGSVHEASLVGGEVGDRGRNLLGLTHPAEAQVRLRALRLEQVRDRRTCQFMARRSPPCPASRERPASVHPSSSTARSRAIRGSRSCRAPGFRECRSAACRGRSRPGFERWSRANRADQRGGPWTLCTKRVQRRTSWRRSQSSANASPSAKFQLGGRRLRFTHAQRRRLARKAKPLGGRRLREISPIVTPTRCCAVTENSSARSTTEARDRSRPPPDCRRDS